MTLALTDSVNKLKDEATFGDLATIAAAQVGNISSAAITGEQKLNGVKDAVTVSSLIGHFRSQYNASLPTTNVPTATAKLNDNVDVVTLDHAVKYLKATAGVTISKPVNSVVPVIAGDGDGPFTVTSPGTWSNTPDSYTYQWQSDGVDISGKTTATLAKDAAYDGTAITCDIHAVNPAGSSVALATSNSINAFGVPVNSVAPVISGSGTGPFSVTNDGTWSNTPTSYTYQWQADTVDITGETTNTLAADAGYVGVSIRCMVTAHNASGASSATASNAIVGA